MLGGSVADRQGWRGRFLPQALSGGNSRRHIGKYSCERHGTRCAAGPRERKVMRRFTRTVALVAVVLAALTALPQPALAANTTRETGSLECDFDEDVWTRVRAKGDHRHLRIGILQIDLDLPDDGLWRVRVFDWNVFAMQWGTGNQINREYDWSGSYATCLT
jgi:hypothetical protein